ncbi:hypothetical protein J2Z31_003234 [Sinorhizobium kostiense]|uniref:Uncharacterized protein n=1 Tax=Sinorhizobium kostiense TaxID=76747 RepID=A0ABS4R1E7_9HYPH|nr:hypothetical protein [Sinorhizobium kostiense]MBP2236720.1 hypothetical protein [Sinorhizobium kostiense]
MATLFGSVVFWHSRRDRDPAHQWLRKQIVRVRDEFEATMRARINPELSIGCPFDTDKPKDAEPAPRSAAVA